MLPRGGAWRPTKWRTVLLLIAPAILLLGAMMVYPVVNTIYLSFRDASVTSSGSFVGIDNYRELFADPVFVEALVTTAIFTVASSALCLTVGLLMALAMHRRFPGRGGARALLLVPWAFPAAISAVMWRLMFADEVGIISYVANALGIISGSILSERTLLLIAVIVVEVWRSSPFVMLVLLAGLQSIPAEVEESANVDGANSIQRFTRVTLPLLKPAILVALLFESLNAWSQFDLFWVVSGRQLESVSTYVYEKVIDSQLFFAVGNAAAVIAFVTTLLIAAALIFGFRMREWLTPS